MSKVFMLFVFLTVSFLTVDGQDSIQSRQMKGKYFKYSILTSSRSAVPLFAISPSENPDMIAAKVDYGHRDWSNFTTNFINQVLKKYFTIEEIREMIQKNSNRASARMFLYFDYDGNIKYVYFIYRNELKSILSDEKLYSIYQDILKLKIDTTGFSWWVAEKALTPEQQKKVYNIGELPFFFKNNCP